MKEQFAKTKFCPFFSTGHCHNGEECTYAHDEVELRPLPNLLKTKLCDSVTRRYVCLRSDCPYAHTCDDLREQCNLVAFKTSLCFFHKKGKCLNGEKCRFAHGNVELKPLTVEEDCESITLGSDGRPIVQRSISQPSTFRGRLTDGYFKGANANSDKMDGRRRGKSYAGSTYNLATTKGCGRRRNTMWGESTFQAADEETRCCEITVTESMRIDADGGLYEAGLAADETQVVRCHRNSPRSPHRLSGVTFADQGSELMTEACYFGRGLWEVPDDGNLLKLSPLGSGEAFDASHVDNHLNKEHILMEAVSNGPSSNTSRSKQRTSSRRSDLSRKKIMSSSDSGPMPISCPPMKTPFANYMAFPVASHVKQNPHKHSLNNKPRRRHTEVHYRRSNAPRSKTIATETVYNYCISPHNSVSANGNRLGMPNSLCGTSRPVNIPFVTDTERQAHLFLHIPPPPTDGHTMSRLKARRSSSPVTSAHMFFQQIPHQLVQEPTTILTRNAPSPTNQIAILPLHDSVFRRSKAEIVDNHVLYEGDRATVHSVNTAQEASSSFNAATNPILHISPGTVVNNHHFAMEERSPSTSAGRAIAPDGTPIRAVDSCEAALAHPPVNPVTGCIALVEGKTPQHWCSVKTAEWNPMITFDPTEPEVVSNLLPFDSHHSQVHTNYMNSVNYEAPSSPDSCLASAPVIPYNSSVRPIVVTHSPVVGPHLFVPPSSTAPPPIYSIMSPTYQTHHPSSPLNATGAPHIVCHPWTQSPQAAADCQQQFCVVANQGNAIIVTGTTSTGPASPLQLYNSSTPVFQPFQHNPTHGGDLHHQAIPPPQFLLSPAPDTSARNTPVGWLLPSTFVTQPGWLPDPISTSDVAQTSPCVSYIPFTGLPPATDEFGKLQQPPPAMCPVQQIQPFMRGMPHLPQHSHGMRASSPSDFSPSHFSTADPSQTPEIHIETNYQNVGTGSEMGESTTHLITCTRPLEESHQSACPTEFNCINGKTFLMQQSSPVCQTSSCSSCDNSDSSISMTNDRAVPFVASNFLGQDAKLLSSGEDMRVQVKQCDTLSATDDETTTTSSPWSLSGTPTGNNSVTSFNHKVISDMQDMS